MKLIDRNMGISGIITGDIIKSRNIKPGSRDSLLNSIQEISNDLNSLSVIKTEIFRGDSFQMFVDDPIQTLRVAILLRAKLRENANEKWDARLAIGIGEINYKTESILTSDGEAYNNSGWEFDELAKRKLAIRTPWSDVNDELKVSMAFADNIISNWTSAQAQVIFISLSSEKMLKEEIAAEINRTTQNASKLLKTANESLIRNFLERYEQIIKAKI